VSLQLIHCASQSRGLVKLASWFATQVEQHKHEAGPWAQVQPYLAQTAEQQQSAINSMLQKWVKDVFKDLVRSIRECMVTP